MKNSINFQDVLKTLKFLFYDSLKSIFRHQILKEKRNQYFFISALIILYFLYFYWNMVYLSNISHNVHLIDQSEFMLLGKITISSYYNSIFVLGIYIAVFVYSTFRLTNRALYIVKVIPLSNTESMLCIQLYKLFVGLAFFEVFLVIVAPGLKLMPMDLISAVLFLISLHIVFIVAFIGTNFIYQVLLKNPKNYNIKKIILDLLLMVSSIQFYFTKRFEIDTFIGSTNMSVKTLILLSICIGLLSIVIIMMLYKGLQIEENTSLESTYVKTKIGKRNTIFTCIMYAILRGKNFIYLSLIVLIITIADFIQNGLDMTMQTLLFLLPVISICAISYADATSKFRYMFPVFSITHKNEFINLLLFSTIFSLPCLMISFLVLKSFNLYFYSLSIMLSAFIIGFIFPKSQGNINETMSSLLVLILILLFSALANIKGALIPVTILLSVILFYILKKEKEAILCRS